MKIFNPFDPSTKKKEDNNMTPRDKATRGFLILCVLVTMFAGMTLMNRKTSERLQEKTEMEIALDTALDSLIKECCYRMADSTGTPIPISAEALGRPESVGVYSPRISKAKKELDELIVIRSVEDIIGMAKREDTPEEKEKIENLRRILKEESTTTIYSSGRRIQFKALKNKDTLNFAAIQYIKDDLRESWLENITNTTKKPDRQKMEKLIKEADKNKQKTDDEFLEKFTTKWDSLTNVGNQYLDEKKEINIKTEDNDKKNFGMDHSHVDNCF